MTIRILLAGSDKTNRALVQLTFAKLDLDIIGAPDIALALFLAKKNFPALIICDLELLDGHGTRLLQELKANNQLQSIPFVFLTAKLPPPSVRKTFIAAGAQNLIDNNISSEELLSLLEPFLQPCNSRATSLKNETTE